METAGKFGSAQGLSSIGPITKDDVELIYSSTWDDPSTWHDPGPDTFSRMAHDRFL